jgi:hypothetical protein
MKISIDDKELFTLTETQKKVIKNDISEEIFDEDMKRRLKYIIMDKYEKCFERLKKEWEPKLIDSGVEMIPTGKDALAELIFSHNEYKNRSQRDSEEKLK